MTGTRQPAPAEREVHVERAKHAQAAFDTEIAATESTVREDPALRFVAHYTSGVFDYSVALSELPGVAAAQHPLPDADRLARVGEYLDATITDFDSACRALDSGALIRVVVHGERGALLHYLKAEGQTVFAYAASDSFSEIRHADRGVAGLLVAVAQRRGASSLNWGGFATEGLGPTTGSVTDEQGLSGDSEHIAHLTEGSMLQRAAAIAHDALDVRGLHYIAMHRDGRPLFERDILDDEELADFFQRVSPLSRRLGYTDAVRTVGLNAQVLNTLLARAGAGGLIRLVLDVARGAVYVIPVGPRTYVTGVTLLQNRVDQAEARFREAAGDIRKVFTAQAL
jgi:hypothetical protein